MVKEDEVELERESEEPERDREELGGAVVKGVLEEELLLCVGLVEDLLELELLENLLELLEDFCVVELVLDDFDELVVVDLELEALDNDAEDIEENDEEKELGTDVVISKEDVLIVEEVELANRAEAVAAAAALAS